LESFGRHTPWTNEDRGSRLLGFEIPPWGWLLVGAGLVLAVVQITTIRPTLRELSDMQSQVSALESRMQTLANQGQTVNSTNDLLGRLVEQGRRNQEATNSLDHIAALHDRLNEQTEQAERALVVMEKLARLQHKLLASADSAPQAAETLEGLELMQARLAETRYATEHGHRAIDEIDNLRQRLIAAKSKAGSACQSLDQIESLNERLLGSEETTLAANHALGELMGMKQTMLDNLVELPAARFALGGLLHLKNSLLTDSDELERAQSVARQWASTQEQLAEAESQAQAARRTSLELMGLADELVCRGETSTAQAALDNLAGIRQRLDDQGTGIDLAGQRLDQLVDLKNRTIDQTRDLGQATESLELMADVHEQLGKIAASFGRMRHWIVEILAFEPAFTRAMRTLQPLTELNNLRRMNPTELRQVLRSLDNRSDTQWTGTDSPTLDSASSTAPVVEGALRTK
jgi:hypothetical protein